MAGLAIPAALVLGVLCGVGAWYDFRHRMLPNWLCAAVLVSGLVFGSALQGGAWMGLSLVHAMAALLVGMVLFAARFIGGGDAKYYAAMAAWLPVQYGLLLLGLVSLAGILVIAFWFPARGRIARMAPDEASVKEFKKVPYGIAISLGTWLAYLSASGLWSSML